MSFKLSKEFKPSGDQPNAVKKLVDQYKKNTKIKFCLESQDREKPSPSQMQLNN